jgi:hypothetical protein
MELKRELVARLEDEDLAGVALGVGPPDLVPPGLLDSSRPAVARAAYAYPIRSRTGISRICSTSLGNTDCAF